MAANFGMKKIERFRGNRLGLIALIAFSISFSSCDFYWEEIDCGENGEFLEGDCVCDQGWAGVECDYWDIDRIVGVYHFDSIAVDSARTYLELGDMRIDGNAPNERTFYFHLSQLRDPIECTLSGFWWSEAKINWQDNFYTDSTGTQSPISLLGTLDYGIAFDEVSLYLESHGCTLTYKR